MLQQQIGAKTGIRVEGGLPVAFVKQAKR